MVYLERSAICCDCAEDTEEADVKGEEDCGEDYGELQLSWDLADQSFRVGGTDPGEEHVECNCCVEGEEWIGGVHESLFFVRLDSEYSEPQVEWREEDGSSEQGLLRRLLRHEEGLDKQHRS